MATTNAILSLKNREVCLERTEEELVITNHWPIGEKKKEHKTATFISKEDPTPYLPVPGPGTQMAPLVLQVGHVVPDAGGGRSPGLGRQLV